MKKLKLGQKVKYIGTDQDHYSLRGKIFKIVAKRIFGDGSENYIIIDKDGYYIEGICNIPQHIEIIR